MKKLVYASWLTLLVSCGSVETEQNSTIKNEDFTKKPLIDYERSTDSFPLEDKSLLGDESLYRLDGDDLDGLGGIPLSDIISLCYQKNYTKAFNLIDKYYASYKKHPNYWNQVGSCYFLRGDFRKAILFYNQSLDMDKKYAPPLNNLGVMFIRQQKFQQAMVYLKKAAKYSPFSKTPIFNLAHLYLQFGLVKRAKRLFSVLNNKYADDVDILSGLGSANLMSGNANNALDYFKQIDDRYLWRPDISLNYAVALRKIGQKRAAIDVYDKIDRGKLGRYKSYYNRVGTLIRR